VDNLDGKLSKIIALKGASQANSEYKMKDKEIQ
jgi:hypothetical protein